MNTPTGGMRSLYEREMRSATQVSDPQHRWAHLERAPFVSQPYPWLHTRNHVAMFALAPRQHGRRESARTGHADHRRLRPGQPWAAIRRATPAGSPRPF